MTLPCSTHAYMATEYAHVIATHTHVTTFRRYDRFFNLNNCQF